MTRNWAVEAKTLESAAGTPAQVSYRKANADIIRRTIEGIGIDSGRHRAEAGIRLVYNLPSAHLPAMLSQGYKNCYDLAAAALARVGGGPPLPISTKRKTIDRAIAGVIGPGARHTNIYYGAIELNGCGMRYYGDFCLVLRPDAFPGKTLVLDRNSYDLMRAPIGYAVRAGTISLADAAQSLAGDRTAAPDMLVCKVLDEIQADRRLLTSGTISQAVLSDEDYHEVPRLGTFEAGDIAEIRITAADAAVEGSIGDRLDRGTTPSVAELLWRERRRSAARAARDHDVPIRIVVSDGRVRA